MRKSQYESIPKRIMAKIPTYDCYRGKILARAELSFSKVLNPAIFAITPCQGHAESRLERKNLAIKRRNMRQYAYWNHNGIRNRVSSMAVARLPQTREGGVGLLAEISA